MNDLISRQTAIEALKELTANGTNKGMVFGEDAVHRIEILPSVQPEHKTGRWITDDSGLGIKCNKCGKSFSDYVNAGTEYIFLEEIPNFCPNCGAEMEGERKE